MTDQIIESRLKQRMPDSWPLLSDTQKLACIIAYSIGYDDGFQVAQAAEIGIAAVQRKIDEYEHTEGSDIQPDTSLRGNSSGAALSPLNMIAETLSNIPGSGYEFLNR